MTMLAIRSRGASMGMSPIRRAIYRNQNHRLAMNVIGVMILVQPAVLCLILACALIVTGLIWIFWLRHIKGAVRQILFGILVCMVTCVVMSVGIYLKYEIAPLSCETIVALEPGLK